MTKSELNNIINAHINQIKHSLESFDDETAIDMITLFPAWVAGIECIAGERLQYENKLYRVVQTHTSQEGWEPSNTPALFTEIAKPGEIPVWKQPTGAQDAYMTGDKVYYPDANGSIYISNIDSNVWAPNVYGWSLEE